LYQLPLLHAPARALVLPPFSQATITIRGQERPKQRALLGAAPISRHVYARGSHACDAEPTWGGGTREAGARKKERNKTKRSSSCSSSDLPDRTASDVGGDIRHGGVPVRCRRRRQRRDAIRSGYSEATRRQRGATRTL